MTPAPSIPRRFRPSRTALAFLLLAALVLIVRLVWGWWLTRELNARLDDARRRGHPVSLSDLTFPQVPDSENAWTLQSQAAALISVDSPRNSNLEYHDYPPYPPDWHKLAQASEQAHAQVFALARQARQRSAVQVRQELKTQHFMARLQYLNNPMGLANTLLDGAAYAHVKGDDVEALERVLDTLHLARSLRHHVQLDAQLVAFSMEAHACCTTRAIAPGLRLDADTHSLTRRKVRQLIEQLLDETSLAPRVRESMLVERLAILDFHNSVPRGTWWIRPLATHEILRANSNLEAMVKAVDCASSPQAKAVLRACGWQERGRGSDTSIAWLTIPRIEHLAPRYSRWFDRYPDDLSFLLERHFWIIADRRATVVSLACQLYRADHGRWPEQLNQLVPGYLAALPRDPFHADGPLGYLVLKGGLPSGGDRPLIYFDAGDTNWICGEPMYGWSGDTRDLPSHQKFTRQPRQYRDVARFIPPPSTKTVDDDPQETDAPGNEPQQKDDPH